MKHHLNLLAVLVCMAAAPSSGALAQPVYKCGSSYSQAPCPGAEKLDVTDTRTPAQKAQTDAAAVQSAKLADQLERERLALEKASAGKPAPKGSGNKKAAMVGAASAGHNAAKKTTAKPKKPPPEFFVAAPTAANKADGKAATKAPAKP